MTDLSTTIAPKSDQTNADDLISGPRTIKITSVTLQSGEQPIVIHYEGDNGKPYLPNKSMRRVLVQIWGKDGNKYIGRSMTIYRDPKVKWAGAEVGGIRISHMSNMDGPVTLSITETKQSRKPYVVKPLEVTKDIYAVGLTISAKGTEELKDWFSKLPDADKKAVKPRLDELKELAAKHDQLLTEETENEENA